MRCTVCRVNQAAYDVELKGETYKVVPIPADDWPLYCLNDAEDQAEWLNENKPEAVEIGIE